jgi:hypothetical protein
MMSGSRKIVIGVLFSIVAGGMALSPLGGSVPGWIYGGVLLAMVVGLVWGVRRLNQQVDALDSDVHSRRSTSVWLAGALSVRHGSTGDGSISGGELLAGPTAAERVAGKPANAPDGPGTGAG